MVTNSALLGPHRIEFKYCLSHTLAAWPFKSYLICGSVFICKIPKNKHQLQIGINSGASILGCSLHKPDMSLLPTAYAIRALAKLPSLRLKFSFSGF